MKRAATTRRRSSDCGCSTLNRAAMGGRFEHEDRDMRRPFVTIALELMPFLA